jgi:hypothetical protein
MPRRLMLRGLRGGSPETTKSELGTAGPERGSVSRAPRTWHPSRAQAALIVFQPTSPLLMRTIDRFVSYAAARGADAAKKSARNAQTSHLVLMT